MSFLHSEDNVEKLWTDLRELLAELTKKFVPFTRLNPEYRNNLLFTNTTRQAIRAKTKFWKKFYCNRTKVNFDNFKEKRNAVKTATRNDQRANESAIDKNVQIKPKKFWSYVRQKIVLQNAIPAFVQDDGSLTTNEIEKVEVLSKFFSSVFTHEPPGEWTIPELDITHPIKDLELSEKLVKEQLDSLIKSKSPEPDEIHPELRFELRDFLTQSRTKIFNKSWDETKLLKTGNLLTLPLSSKKGKTR